MKYWKVRFDDTLEGFGYLAFDESMISQGLFDENGELITQGVSYTPIEFDITPPWVA